MQEIILSVITINYNNKAGLIKTIESVINQTYSKFEFIVIDGGSNDGSVEVIKQYQSYVSYWISEPDKGIYSAQNKGVAKAKGKYVNFLNSGDYYVSPNVLSSVFSNPWDDDVLYGSPIHVYTNGKTELSLHPPKVDFLLFYTQSINHQASFIKRELLVQNPYNEDYTLASDWEFFLKAAYNNCSFAFVNQVICYYEMGGFSTKPANASIHTVERQKVLNSFLPLWMQEYFNELAAIKKTKISKHLYYLRDVPLLDSIITKIARFFISLHSFYKH